MALGDVERSVGLDTESDLEANTLSGLFMERLGRLPVVGDAVETEQYRLRVLSVEDHRVGRVAIEYLGPHTNEPTDTRPDEVQGATEI